MEEEDLDEYFHLQYGERMMELLQEFPHIGEQWESEFPSIQEMKDISEAKMMRFAVLQKEEMVKHKMGILKHRWEELDVKEAELKADMKKYEKFVQENDQKWIRAMKKATKERYFKRQGFRELAKARQELPALRLKQEQLHRKLQKYSKFNEYLEKVVENSQFEEIHEVMAHYKTLVTMNSALMQSMEEGQEKVERAKARLAHFVQEKEDEMLKLGNELAALQVRFDRARNNVIKWVSNLMGQDFWVYWESRWEQIQNTATKKTLLLGTIKMATLNLFQTVTKHCKEATSVSVDDTHKQLDVIQQYILDLTDILAEVKKKEQQQVRV